jgi:hypothetical protein
MRETASVRHRAPRNIALTVDSARESGIRDAHAAAVALYFMYYKFGRVHQTLRVTPAMEAGVANHVWSVEEIVGLLD